MQVHSANNLNKKRKYFFSENIIVQKLCSGNDLTTQFKEKEFFPRKIKLSHIIISECFFRKTINESLILTDP